MSAARRQTFGFIGVTASQSSINRVFPRWAEVLNLGDVAFDPIDLAPGSSRDTYRETLRRIVDDPSYRGALVTTHKVNLLHAAEDMLDTLDGDARLLGEISCLKVRDGRLHGSAKDVITSGRSIADFVPPGHFDSGAQVLCLGAGGAGLAIAVHLLDRHPACGTPEKVILVNRSSARLQECAQVLDRVGVLDRVELVQNQDPAHNDELCAALPAGSLLINATGMGKDRPGSPITDDVRLPQGGLVWELNYRGELEFLHQARRQAEARDLVVEDGWRYFVHGWSEVVSEVFDVTLDEGVLGRLAAEAETVRT